MTDSTQTLVQGFMERHHLTQQQLADHLGVAQNSVSRWQRGQRQRTSPTLIALALEALERRLLRPVPREVSLDDMLEVYRQSPQVAEWVMNEAVRLAASELAP